MRANPRTRIRPDAHPHAHIHIHPCTHTYARIRAREGIFLTTNLSYIIIKPTSIISPTPFTSIIQSLYNPYPYWHHIGSAICTNCQHLSSSVIHLHPYTNYPPTIHLSLISHSLLPFPIITNSPSTHHISSLFNFQSNSSYYQYVSML